MATNFGSKLTEVGSSIKQALMPVTYYTNNARLSFMGFVSSLTQLSIVVPSVRQAIKGLQAALISLPSRAIRPLVVSIDAANSKPKKLAS